MTPKWSKIIKMITKWCPKATKVHQKGSQNEQGTSKKEPCGKVSIFEAKNWIPYRVFGVHFGSQESNRMDVTSPGLHFWTLQNVCFYWGFNRIWANGSVCRDLKVMPSSFFSMSKFVAKKLRTNAKTWLKAGLTKAHRTLTIQQDTYGV